MDEAGNNPRNLTNSPKAADSSPSWSPDKQQIVLARSSRAQGGILEEREEEAVAASDIYLMSASGQNRRQLTDHPADDRDPSWSPDGRQIAFVSARDGDAIYIIETSGNNLRRLTNDANLIGITSTNWSLDGRHIAFASWFIGKGEKNKGSGICTINQDGKNLRLITENLDLTSFESPKWSPDGKQILFTASVQGQGKKRPVPTAIST